jgi:hypothetical protein
MGVGSHDTYAECARHVAERKDRAVPGALPMMGDTSPPAATCGNTRRRCTGSDAVEQFGRMGAVDELGTHAWTDVTGRDEPERVVQGVGVVGVAADRPPDLVLRPVHDGGRVRELVHDRGDQRGNT